MRSTSKALLAGTILTVGMATVSAAVAAREPGADGDDQARECPSVPTKGMEDYVLRVAWAEGRTEAQALEAARSSARAQLVDQLCQDYDNLRCAAVRRHVQDWEDGYWVPPRQGRPGSACAAVTIERRFMDLPQHEYEAFDGDLTALADRIRDELGEAPMVLEAPTWASGCNAGDLGAAIASELRTRLQGTRIVTPGKRPAGAQVLRLTLGPGADMASLDASLRPVGDDVETGLGGLRFPPDLFGIAPDDVGVCAGESRTGVVDRAGAGGLTVEVLFQTEDGLACDGSRVPMGLYTNQPARIWLFSVAPDGTAYLIWPADAGGAPAGGELSLGTVDISRFPDGGDELLVAAALPPDHTWTPVSAWRGACRVPGGMESLGWPAASAVGTRSYTVVRAGEGHCPAQTTIDPTEVTAALARLPVCGG